MRVLVVAVFCILFSILFSSSAAAETNTPDLLIINSNDWRDIYTGIIYAQLTGKDAYYVAEKTQGLQLINEVIDKSKKNILLIESKIPVAVGYKSLLENAGFTVDKYLSEDPYLTNLKFAQKAAQERNVNSFIIIDAKLGYGAVSVAPYATISKSFVVFAHAENSYEIENLLAEKGEKVLLYGRIDREIKEELLPLNPEIINEGDDYLDNVEIVSRFLEKEPAKQVIFTSGEVLEKSFFNKEFPVLLIGSDIISEHVLDFLKDSSITTAVVVGYDLFSNAKKIKDATGIKILLKYGQGRNSELYALDVFPLPKYDLRIDISGIRYNTLSSKLEVTYKNLGNAFALIQAISHRIASDGKVIAEVGDEKPVLLNPADETTILYSADLSSYIDSELTAESTIVFGQSAASLTRLFMKKGIPVEVVAVDDDSSISLEKVLYNKKTGSFEISVRNAGSSDVFADVEIINLVIADEKVTLGAEPQKISTGKTALFEIKADLRENDFERNRAITVQIRYGQREGILIKTLLKEFNLEFKGREYKPLILIAIVAILTWMMVRHRKRRQA